MKNIANYFAAFVVAASFSLPAVAQEAKSLDELLQMIESAAISETAESKKREADFKRDQRNQANALKRAENTRTAEERRSDRLEQTIRDNDIQIAKLREQRDKRLGSLKELFGHLTGAAGDKRAICMEKHQNRRVLAMGPVEGHRALTLSRNSGYNF